MKNILLISIVVLLGLKAQAEVGICNFVSLNQGSYTQIQLIQNGEVAVLADHGWPYADNLENGMKDLEVFEDQQTPICSQIKVSFNLSNPMKLYDPAPCVIKYKFAMIHSPAGTQVTMGGHTLINHDRWMYSDQTKIFERTVQDANQLKKLGVCTAISIDLSEASAEPKLQ